MLASHSSVHRKPARAGCQDCAGATPLRRTRNSTAPTMTTQIAREVGHAGLPTAHGRDANRCSPHQTSCPRANPFGWLASSCGDIVKGVCPGDWRKSPTPTIPRLWGDDTPEPNFASGLATEPPVGWLGIGRLSGCLETLGHGPDRGRVRSVRRVGPESAGGPSAALGAQWRSPATCPHPRCNPGQQQHDQSKEQPRQGRSPMTGGGRSRRGLPRRAGDDRGPWHHLTVWACTNHDSWRNRDSDLRGRLCNSFGIDVGNLSAVRGNRELQARRVRGWRSAYCHHQCDRHAQCPERRGHCRTPPAHGGGAHQTNRHFLETRTLRDLVPPCSLFGAPILEGRTHRLSDVTPQSHRQPTCQRAGIR